MSVELHWQNQRMVFAREEKGIPEMQTNVLKVRTLQNMHRRLAM